MLHSFSNGSPIDDPSFVDPTLEDILLPDVNEKIVETDIAQELGVTNLETTHDKPQWPVHGIVFGPNSRLYVCLFVRSRDMDEYTKVISLSLLVICVIYVIEGHFFGWYRSSPYLSLRKDDE